MPKAPHPSPPARASRGRVRALRVLVAAIVGPPSMFAPVRATAAIAPHPAVVGPRIAGCQVAPPEAPRDGGAASSPAFPDDPRLDQALLMLRRGAFGPAATVARTVRAQHPGIDRATAILAIALEKEKRYEEARGLLEAAARSPQPFPERAHVPHFLGWCCYHLGDLEAAKAAFESHLANMPDEPDSTFGLGLVALGEDRLDDADALFAKALARFSEPKPSAVDQARVLTRMADLALRRDDVAEAERLLDRAIAASPLQHETWSKMARVRDRLGKHEEAEAARRNVDRILESLGRRRTGSAAGSTVPTNPGKAPDSAPAAPAPAEQPSEAPPPAGASA